LRQELEDQNNDDNANVNAKKTPEDIWEHVLQFHSAIGWDTEAQDTMPSAPLAAGTWEEQVVSAAALFSHFGIPNALTKVQQWHQTLSDHGELHGTDDPVISISNLRHVLQTCRDDYGLLVAICTSDDRTGTNAAILHWNITDLIDVRNVYYIIILSCQNVRPLLRHTCFIPFLYKVSKKYPFS
jgi:hypothetical protein